MFALSYVDYTILKIIAIIALGLLVVILRFSNFIPNLVFRVLGDAAACAPEESKADAKANKRLAKIEAREENKWFNILMCSFIVLVFISLFLPATSFLHIPDNWFGATIAIGFTTIGVVVYFGANIYGGRRGWFRWSFWLSVLLGIGAMFTLSYWYHPRRRGGVELVALIGFLTFFSIFSILRNIDNQHPVPKPER